MDNLTAILQQYIVIGDMSSFGRDKLSHPAVLPTGLSDFYIVTLTSLSEDNPSSFAETANQIISVNQTFNLHGM